MTSFPDFERHDALGLAALVRAGEVSARELVEAAIERIEARDGDINAVVHRSFERARAQAAEPSRYGEGPFAGVPFLLKDLKGHDAGQPATGGSRLLAAYRARADEPLVARFKAAGLIICGRTNSPEFGILGVTEPELHGPTRNPWQLDRVPGGSSGGAAAAVAAGMVPLAHASDGGGSIRIPAANCGLVGLKPTRFRIPVGNPVSSWADFAVPHVLTRSVRDSATMLDCLHGPVPGVAARLAPPDEPYARSHERAPERLRIAVYKGALFASDNDPACVAAVEHAAKLCAALGHELVEAKPRFDRAALVRAYLSVVACSVAATVAHTEGAVGRRARPHELEAKTWLLKALGEVISAPEYIAQLQLIHEAALELDRFFDDYDLLLTSTLARPPIEVGAVHNTRLERSAAALVRRVSNKRVMMGLLDELARDPLAPNPNTQLFNMSGQPAISLPLWWHEGLPIGVQFAARLGREDLLLALARALEQAEPWFERRAPVCG